MGLLEVSTYDLQSTEGQSQAIDDIITEYNNQDDQTNNYNSLQIAAFGVATVTLASPPWTGGPITVFNHGLGYAPAFLVYFGLLSSGGIFSSPLVDYSSILGLAGSVNFFTDSQNLYLKWDDHAQTPTQQITYIIFQRPIVN